MKENNFIQSRVLEILMLIATAVLAALLGNNLANFATRQIANSLTKLIIDIPIGLGVGISASILVRNI